MVTVRERGFRERGKRRRCTQNGAWCGDGDGDGQGGDAQLAKFLGHDGACLVRGNGDVGWW